MIDRFDGVERRIARFGAGTADGEGAEEADRNVPERYDSIDLDDETVVIYDRERPPSWIQSDEVVRLDRMT